MTVEHSVRTFGGTRSLRRFRTAAREAFCGRVISNIKQPGLVVQWIVRKSQELDIPVRFWARLQSSDDPVASFYI